MLTRQEMLTDLTQILSLLARQTLPAPPLVTTSQQERRESQTEETWRGNYENIELEETSTEEYDAINEMHAMIENELYLLQEEDNTPSETNEDEMTTTKTIIQSEEENMEESKLNEIDYSTIPTVEETKASGSSESINPVSNTAEDYIDSQTDETEIPDNTAEDYIDSQKDETEIPDNTAENDIDSETSEAEIPDNQHIGAAQRQALISELGNIDLSRTDLDTLVLSPRQRLAITEELQYQQLGLPVFTDPTPWQRLSQTQQEEFNKKYLALSPELQEFSREQFLSISERGQKHAYNAFLTLDSNTLTAVIREEMKKIKSGLVSQDQVTNELREEFRSSVDGVKINNLNFDDIEENTAKKSRYDPRRQRQPQQRQRLEVTENRNIAQELHLKYARAQLQQAIHLQACLANPATCARLNIS